MSDEDESMSSDWDSSSASPSLPDQVNLCHSSRQYVANAYAFALLRQRLTPVVGMAPGRPELIHDWTRPKVQQPQQIEFASRPAATDGVARVPWSSPHGRTESERNASQQAPPGVMGTGGQYRASHDWSHFNTQSTQESNVPRPAPQGATRTHAWVTQAEHASYMDHMRDAKRTTLIAPTGSGKHPESTYDRSRHDSRGGLHRPNSSLPTAPGVREKTEAPWLEPQFGLDDLRSHTEAQGTMVQYPWGVVKSPPAPQDAVTGIGHILGAGSQQDVGDHSSAYSQRGVLDNPQSAIQNGEPDQSHLTGTGIE